jgi:hypothetical protein
MAFLHLHTVRTALDDVLRLCLAFSHTVIEHSDDVTAISESTLLRISKVASMTCLNGGHPSFRDLSRPLPFYFFCYLAATLTYSSVWITTGIQFF